MKELKIIYRLSAVVGIVGMFTCAYLTKQTTMGDLYFRYWILFAGIFVISSLVLIIDKILKK